MDSRYTKCQLCPWCFTKDVLLFFFFFVFLNYNLFSYSQSHSHILVHSSISSGVRGDLAEAVRVFSPPNCI